MKKKEKFKNVIQPTIDPKLNLNRLLIRKEVIGQINNPMPVSDIDWPTVNDHCCLKDSNYNTIKLCDPKDWCGWLHESDCRGPFVTVPNA